MYPIHIRFISTCEWGLKPIWEYRNPHAFFLLTRSWVISDLCRMGGNNLNFLWVYETRSNLWFVNESFIWIIWLGSSTVQKTVSMIHLWIGLSSTHWFNNSVLELKRQLIIKPGVFTVHTNQLLDSEYSTLVMLTTFLIWCFCIFFFQLERINPWFGWINDDRNTFFGNSSIIHSEWEIPQCIWTLARQPFLHCQTFRSRNWFFDMQRTAYFLLQTNQLKF